MKAGFGVLLEVAVLGAILGAGRLIPSGIPFAIFVVASQLAATYLTHCPAHYMVGAIVGIRFGSIRRGRTTLAKVLTGKLAGLAGVIPILTLSTVKNSLTGKSRVRVASMYAAGTFASVTSAFVIAAAATWMEAPTYAALAWAVALGYLAFDVVFSPRSGDLMKARAALRG
jgi:hypothetical protein